MTRLEFIILTRPPTCTTIHLTVSDLYVDRFIELYGNDPASRGGPTDSTFFSMIHSNSNQLRFPSSSNHFGQLSQLPDELG